MLPRLGRSAARFALIDEASFVKEVEKIEFLSLGARSGSESHIHEYVEKLLLINRELQGSFFEMPEKLLCFHVLHNVAKFNQHFVSGYIGQHARCGRRDVDRLVPRVLDEAPRRNPSRWPLERRPDSPTPTVIRHLGHHSGRDMELQNLKAQVALPAFSFCASRRDATR